MFRVGFHFINTYFYSHSSVLQTVDPLIVLNIQLGLNQTSNVISCWTGSLFDRKIYSIHSLLLAQISTRLYKGETLLKMEIWPCQRLLFGSAIRFSLISQHWYWHWCMHCVWMLSIQSPAAYEREKEEKVRSWNEDSKQYICEKATQVYCLTSSVLLCFISAHVAHMDGFSVE